MLPGVAVDSASMSRIFPMVIAIAQQLLASSSYEGSSMLIRDLSVNGSTAMSGNAPATGAGNASNKN